MKRIIFLLLSIMLFAAANGQKTKPYPWQWNATPYEFDKTSHKSVLQIPRDTTATDSGSVAIKNGTLYVKWGYWREVEGGGGSSDSTLEAITANGKNVTPNSIKVVKKDSIGNILTYPWDTGTFGSTLSDQTSTGTVTATSGKTTVNGTLGYNLNNRISYTNEYIGVENWEFKPGGFVVTQKNGTSYGFGIRLEGTVGSVPDAFFHYRMTDTATYISFTTGNTLPTYSTSANNRNTSTFKFSLSDTLYPVVRKINRVVTAYLVNKTTGDEMELAIPECAVTVGLLHVYFYSQWDVVGNLTIDLNEIFRPDFAFEGDSNMWNVGTQQGRSYVNQFMERKGGSFVLMAAPFERAAEGLLRRKPLEHVDPDYLVYGYGVNLDDNLDSFARRSERIAVHAMGLPNNKGVIFLGLIPQTSRDVTPWDDSLKAIKSRYPKIRYVDFTTPVQASSGTAMATTFNLDNVHINGNGHDKEADVLYNKTTDIVVPDAPIIASPSPISYNPAFGAGIDRFGNLVRTIRDSLNKFIENILYVDGFANYQVGNIYLNGNVAILTPGGGRYIISGNGNLSNPNFKIESGTVTINARFDVGTGFSVVSNQANFPGNTVWSNTLNTSTTAQNWTVNNPAGSGINAGWTYDNAVTDYTSAAHEIMRWKKSGVTVAAVLRDGNVKAAKESGYYLPLDYSAMSGNAWPTKTHLDSLLALVVAGGGSMSNPMTTTGDMVRTTSGSTPARLAIGSAGDALRVVGGVPAWSSNAYIENQSASAQSSSTFWMSGTGRTDGFFRSKTGGAFNGANTGGIQIYGASNVGYNQSGYDDGVNAGWTQSIRNGVAYDPYYFNPGGGSFCVGCAATAPASLFQIESANYPAFTYRKTGAFNWSVGNTPQSTGTDWRIRYNTTDWVNIKTTGETGFGGMTSPTSWIELGATAGTIGPLKFNSASLLGTPQVGLVEFLTDKLYFTISTSTARKELTLNDAALTSTRVPYATINGRLTDNGNFTTNGSRISIGGSSPSTSTMDIQGSVAAAIVTVTANTTIDETYHTILVDATSGNLTITLPPAGTCNRRIYIIKKIDASANTVTIEGDGSETIDGALNRVLSTQWGKDVIQSNGTSHFVIN